MPAQPLPVAKCLDALLRYELAAARCYQLAERLLPADRDALAAVRRAHEAAAALLEGHVAGLGSTPSTEPGLWGVLPLLAEAANTGRAAVLTTLRWAEQHGVQTYETAARICGLPAVSRALIANELLPGLHAHVRLLDQMLTRPGVAA